ncbi:putative transmembrane protein [Mycobacterium xenopi 3993]|nr:putative transmembrane protein [Mycobacterium xenopi 3993]
MAIGHSLGMTLPARPMAFASAIAFLVFAAWTWREAAPAPMAFPRSENRDSRCSLSCRPSCWQS